MNEKLLALYKEAIEIQDACNLSGVIGFACKARDILNEERRERGEGTSWFNHHPVMVMIASKMASLTACEDMEVFSQAYNQCKS